ncbi:heat shock protein transcriptional repressor HspR [Nocardiopsis valliformis]|uniref:heat shock protein transcriptional repressor HspR n=1 Tax=Nocardiopsis valliformis TaxID=239974 RepID=UPI00034C94DD|nr:helix-turn-helix transcriptional regulator [Nocardiopsis valliformis]
MNNVNDPAFGADAPVYVISVAAELAGMHPQTLRQYDRLGIVSPGRTSGRGRRYSMRDVRTLREVQRLSQEEGINLAGIKRILELQHEVEQLREQVFHLANELEAARRAVSRRGRPMARPEGGPVRGELVRRTRVTIFNTAEPEGEHPDRSNGRNDQGGQSGPGGQGGPSGQSGHQDGPESGGSVRG